MQPTWDESAYQTTPSAYKHQKLFLDLVDYTTEHTKSTKNSRSRTPPSLLCNMLLKMHPLENHFIDRNPKNHCYLKQLLVILELRHSPFISTKKSLNSWFWDDHYHGKYHLIVHQSILKSSISQLKKNLNSHILYKMT